MQRDGMPLNLNLKFDLDRWDDQEEWSPDVPILGKNRQF